MLVFLGAVAMVVSAEMGDKTPPYIIGLIVATVIGVWYIGKGKNNSEENA